MESSGGMSVKLMMYWDIKPGRDQDYFEFVVREWVPGITRLGVQTTGAWYSVWSRTEGPQIMAEAVVDDLQTAQRVLKSPEWLELHDRLLEYVNNYKQKVVRTTGYFQL
jgi:hypothetical protein